MSGLIHLDPKGFGDLLALGDREIRVLLGILSLAPDGTLLANEGRLARRAGLKGTRELHEVLDGMATGATSKGKPVIARDTWQKQARVKVIGPAHLLVSHQAARSAPAKAPAAPVPATVGPAGITSQLAKRAAAVRGEYGDNLADLTETWIGHLASLHPKRALPSTVAVLQWDAVAELAATYGLEAAMTSLRAGLGGVKDLGTHPEQYLRSVARSHYVKTPTGGRRRHAVIAAAPQEEFPL